ncbi:MAG: HAD-IA family hydrolase [Clostridia bacterium]|nr:HAD-IA family hydrolase [Clostridia bacterium]
MFSVIFDMDGTLLATQQIYVPAWDIMGARQGVENLGRRLPEVCGMNEQGWCGFLKEQYPEMDVERFKNEVYAYVAEHQTLTFKKGALELLDFLKAHHIKMAVASGSNTDMVRAHMEELGALDYFETVVGGEQVQRGKPAPDIYLQAAKALGADPADCFAVEDSGNGIRSAHAAGMKCIGVPDLAAFNEEIKALLFAELTSLEEGIQLLRPYV